MMVPWKRSRNDIGMAVKVTESGMKLKNVGEAMRYENNMSLQSSLKRQKLAPLSNVQFLNVTFLCLVCMGFMGMRVHLCR